MGQYEGTLVGERTLLALGVGRDQSDRRRDVASRTRCLAPQFPNGRKLPAICGCMRTHGLPAAAKDHGRTGDRAAALDVLTKPLGVVLTPGPVVGAMYQCLEH